MVQGQPKGCDVETLNPSEIMKNGFGSSNSNWKGGVRTDRGYIRILAPDHPSVLHLKPKYRYVFEHRLVVERFLGRYLKSDEHVHHRNEIKNDNRLENLELLKIGQHSTHHNNNYQLVVEKGRIVTRVRREFL